MTPKRFNGELLRRLRFDQRLTVADLSRRTGASPNAIRFWESGECDPSFSAVVRLAESLGIEVGCFVAAVPKPKERGKR